MRRACLVLVLGLLVLAPLSAPGRADDGSDGEDGTTDPRVATVLAAEGRALVRPAGHRRWSPLAKDAVLLPGDLVKTGARGANALELAAAPAGSLLLGPGTLVELPERGLVRVLEGEAEVRGEKDAALRVEAPGPSALEVAGTVWVRVVDGKPTWLDEEPRWLKDYRASAGEEWMGSLLAKIDGRDVPLAVGYHKVTADIRDQIARTTVEQSFVNTTDQRLEGVFYFPLPPDASISGFAMWIGNELVEADVVERSRARQIYEDILRRKKDPGLLEWQGGNLFKARVFPIEAHSEKRIRLRYTQVLKLEGSTWRYRYALRSDLLRAKPLRQLDVQVNVLSTREIKEVASPSHATRIRSTGHEARVELSAEEYVPTRDLEVAVTLAPAGGVTAVSHRRGDDGYFMLLLQPPAPEAAGWQRSLVPEGTPLDLVLIADTSGSMDDAARNTQATFLDALLSLLGEEDRFRLAVADAEVRWALDGPRLPDADNVKDALAFLEARSSLGWTDLDRTLEAALTDATERTVVVYVGDGIPTTGDADAVAQANRLRQLGAKTAATVHAVACASTYEKGVLDALASIGGGSVRRADGNPVQAAEGLLSEAARPVLRDLQVAIEGIKTARVYPTDLPNLPVGSQQAVLGRFWPTTEAQTGEVVVTGSLGGKPVRYTTSLAVPAAGAGNSFLPRLWARRHLDALLAQGRSPEVQAEIVSFSQGFGIMTPYTSFLVLESDEDRERYGVARTAQMRDGEAFFAEGRDKVALEMLRQHARQARTWRLGLRRQMLKEIAGLGRDLVPSTPLARVVALGETGRSWAAADRGLSGDSQGIRAPGMVTAGVPVARMRGKGRSRGAAPEAELGRADPAGAPEPVIKDEEIADHVETDNDLPFEESLGEDGISDAPFTGPSNNGLIGSGGGAGGRFGGRGGYRDLGAAGGGRRRLARQDFAPGYFERSVMGRPQQDFLAPAPRAPSPETLGWPNAPAVLEAPPERPAPDWDPAVFEILKKIDHRAALAAVPGGLQVHWKEILVHPVRNETLSQTEHEVLYGAPRWFVRILPDGGEAGTAWHDGETRAVVGEYRRLGRRRPATQRDGTLVPEALGTVDLESFVERFRRLRVTIASSTGKFVQLRIEGRRLADADRLVRVDTERGVIVEERTIRYGRTQHRIRYSGFVQVAGLWWPRLTEHFDVRDRRVSYETREVTALEPAAFQERFAASIAGHDDVLMLGLDLPSLADAKQALAENRAELGHRLTVLLHEYERQRWDDVLAAWAQAKATIADGPAKRWIDLVLLATSRRPTDLLRHLSDLVAAIEPGDVEAAWWARTVYGHVRSRLGPTERLDLLHRLRPAFAAPSDRDLVRFLHAEALACQEVGRDDEARRVRAELLKHRPFDVPVITKRAADLQSLGDVDAAKALLTEKIRAAETGEILKAEEKTSLFGHLANLLFQERDFEALAPLLARWETAVPDAETGPWSARSLAYLRGEVAASDQWVLAQLQAPVPQDIFSAERARLGAALDLALGTGNHFSVRRVEPLFRDALADLGRRLAREETEPAILLPKLLGRWTFRRTDAHRLLLEGLREDLLAGDRYLTLEPVLLDRYVRRLSWGGAAEREQVATLTEGLATRWAGMPSSRDRDVVAEALLHVLGQGSDRARTVAFLERWLAAEAGFRRVAVAARLFDALLAMEAASEDDREKHQQREDAAFALLPDLLDPLLAPRDYVSVAQTAARRLAAWSYEQRRKVALGDRKARQGRTRAEARAHERAARRTARAGVVERLALATVAAPEVYRPWLELERLGYAVELGEDLPAVEAAARELLDGVAPTSEEPSDRLRAERAALVLAYAATRRNSPEGLAERVLSLLLERVSDETDERLDWRYQVFRLLVALDRTEDLETRLRTWIQPTKVRSIWRIALGYLIAERGRLDEAAALFETVASRDELSASQAEVLAGWYLALGDDEKRRGALDTQYGAMAEYELRNLFTTMTGQVSRRGPGLPPDVDPEAYRVLEVLFQKSPNPSHHIWHIRRFYEAVRDHRTLAAFAEAIPGHTPEAIYEFLQALTPTLMKVFEEATVDEAVARLEARRASVKTAHEKRGLWLYEAILRARAALVKNADPAHERGAIAALVTVGEGAWEPGERKRLALLIARLPKLENMSLARAQVDLLTRLLAAEADDAPDRLVIADALARTYWTHGEHEAAIDLLSSSLDLERARTKRPLGHSALRILDRLVSYFAKMRHFQDAEHLLVAERERQEYVSKKLDLDDRRLRLYAEALEGRGTVSLGTGEALLDAALSEANAALESWPAQRVRRLARTIVALHSAAQKARVVPDAGSRLENWARATLPASFGRCVLERTYLVDTAAEGLKGLQGPKAAIGYVLDQRDAEPTFFTRISLDLWSRMDRDLARWRAEAGAIGALAPRLLVPVVASLEEHLRGGRNDGRTFWNDNYKQYWAAQRPAFHAAATRVAELSPDDLTTLMRCADYLRENGGRQLAVSVLESARARGVTSAESLSRLATWLVKDDRHADAIPVVGELLERWEPGLSSYVLAAKVHHGAGQHDRALEILRETEKTWRERDRWGYGPAVTLGRAAVEMKAFAPAERWIDESIRLVQESKGRVSAPTWILLARARAGQARTDDAVDAVASALGATRAGSPHQRKALQALRTILAEAADLEAYAARYEARVAKDGLDAPVLRKAIATAWLEKSNPGAALPHLLAAREIAPEDAETHQKLVEVYDALGDGKGALAALLASLRLAPRNLEAASDLAHRFAEAGDEAAAERARTHLVEPLPEEADGHRRLAVIRQKQDRLAESAVQWRQVVRTDPLDPQGWLALARVQTRLGDPKGARTSLEHVLRSDWEQRFGDVKKEAATLLGALGG